MQKRIYIFDFDGVIVDSVKIKRNSFEKILSQFFSKEATEEFLQYHDTHPGVSRRDQMIYFFEHILHTPSIPEDTLESLLHMFSELTLSECSSSDTMIEEVVQWIQRASQSGEILYIASAAEERDLKLLCEIHHIAPFFQDIFGGPTPKANQIQKIVMMHPEIETKNFYMIGDSYSDFQAAEANHISFIGYNNDQHLQGQGFPYLARGEFVKIAEIQ